MLLCITSAGPGAEAKVALPHLFTDNMVLQADTAALLWGEASPGAVVAVIGSWGEKARVKADADGHWQTRLRTPEPGFEPLSVTFTDKSDRHSITLQNVLAGEVWIAAGQSNMDMPLRGYWHQPVEGGGEEIMFSTSTGRGIRFLNVPRAMSASPINDFNAQWQVSCPANTAEFSALAWFFARHLRDLIDRPVGIINSAYGGSKIEYWIPDEILNRHYGTPLVERDHAGEVFNTMLCPLAGFTARGFLWNQGESNVGGHTVYPLLQACMLAHWRSLWGGSGMHFYFVELPGWEYGDINGTRAALFREAQHKAAADTPGAHIVCTSDLVYSDESDDIHARNKRDIGLRMAAAAATYSYGIKGIPHRYPTYKSVELLGGKAVVSFNDMWQGFTPNENLEGFEVAGDDRLFHKAIAEIDHNALTITVSSPAVADIKAVRYCFKNFAIGRIHDMLGLPIVPFRTDSWEE